MTGDAIGAHTHQVNQLISEMGFRSEIFAEAVGFDVPVRAHLFSAYPGRGSPRDIDATVLLYQSSTGCVIADFLREKSEPIIVNYHNITPSADFECWDIRISREMDKGRQDLRNLARRSIYGLADSEYNRRELVEAGYAASSVAPILFDSETFDRPVDRPTADWLARDRARGGANLLFVGRVVPNKAHHHLIMAFSAFRRFFDPDARLYLVGICPVPGYLPALRRLTADLDVYDAVEFTGHIGAAELSAYYQAADVFLCLSDHEGFCVPLLEAMHNRVPIVAFSAAAVPETLGDAGLLLESKEPLHVAAAVHAVLENDKLAKALVAAGERRLADFSLERTRVQFRAGLEQALSLLD